MKLKIAFFGTPNFSARLLKKIITDPELKQILEVKLVVTQPDKPVGRKQILTPSPVKVMAQKYNLKVIDDLKMLQVTGYTLHDIDLALLFAYGEIIPAKVLASPRMGFFNIHLSPLPKFRGPSPIAYPLIIGNIITGVTLMKMNEKIDEGPIISQIEYKIPANSRRPDLEISLTDFGYELFKKTLIQPISTGFNRFQLTNQDDSQATYTRLLTKKDGYIPLSVIKKALNNEPLTANEIPKIITEYYSRNNLTTRLPSPSGEVIGGQVKQFNNEAIYNLFRGLFPWPGIWTMINIDPMIEPLRPRRLKITDMDYHNNKLIIKRVQLEGKNEVDFATFQKAYQIKELSY